MGTEKTTSVKITKKANETLNAVAKDRGIGKIELVSRVAHWFAKQDRTLQAIVLGQIDPVDEMGILELVMARVGGQSSDQPGDYIEHFLQSLTDQLERKGNSIKMLDQKSQAGLDHLRELLACDHAGKKPSDQEAEKIVAAAEAGAEEIRQRPHRRSPKSA